MPTRLPAVTTVPPVYELLPESVNVPEPSFVRPRAFKPPLVFEMFEAYVNVVPVVSMPIDEPGRKPVEPVPRATSWSRFAALNREVPYTAKAVVAPEPVVRLAAVQLDVVPP